MTSLAFLLVQAQRPELRVLELVESSPYVVVQAYVKAPEMTEREAAAWQTLGRVLLSGTVEYTPQVLRDYGSQAGLPPSVTVMPDWLRVQIVLPKQGLSLAGDLMFSILTRSTFREDDVSKAVAELEAEQRSPWVTAMTGIDFRYDLLRPGDVERVWSRALRLSNMNFVVGGGIERGSGRAELERRFARWNPERDPGPPRADRPPSPKVSYGQPVSTFLLTGQTMTPATVSGAAKLLAVYAIGVGKGSSMFRVLREEKAWSYMQSAVLWPTSEGWSPSFVMVRKTEEEEGKYAGAMRDALVEDIESWTPETLSRAQAMAEASFTRDLAISPVWLGPSGPRAQTLYDRCAWRGYLEMVGSGSLREEVLVSAMKNVDLDRLKEQAYALLDECNVGWLPGRP